MSDENPIESFGFAEHVASFLLHEAFRYAHEAAAYEVAGILFGSKLKNIELADPEWQPSKSPDLLSEWLVDQDEAIDNAIDSETGRQLSDAWCSSLEEAYISETRISKNTRLRSTTDMVGHIVNLTICLEGSLNRHLFYLRETQRLEASYYNSIDRSELMPKILFSFKEQILNGALHIDRIKQLASMRNKSVHYRVDSPRALQPSVEDLLGIWYQLGQIFDLAYGEPSKRDIQNLAEKFVDRWVRQ